MPKFKKDPAMFKLKSGNTTPFKQMGAIGNPEGGGSPDMDFATERSKPRKIDFGKAYDYTADPARDYSPHNISARKTEGTIEEQKRLREAFVPFNREAKGKRFGKSPAKQKMGGGKEVDTRAQMEKIGGPRDKSLTGSYKRGKVKEANEPKPTPRTKEQKQKAAASPAKAHEPGHTKVIKGTSIFGKSPKEFAKSVVDPLGLYRKGKKAYDTYKSKKATKPQGDSVGKVTKKGLKEGITEGAMEVMGMKRQGVKDSMKPVKRGKRMMKKDLKPIEKKRTMTDKTKMKPPYKKPVGPRAN